MARKAQNEQAQASAGKPQEARSAGEAGIRSIDLSEVVERALERMADGQTLGESAKALGVPAWTLRRRIAEDEALYERYKRARDLMGMAMAEEALEVARSGTQASAAQDRVLIETLKWAAGKANADYSDRQTVEHKGTQTLRVEVVEEEKPVRNEKAMQVSARISAMPLRAIAGAQSS